MVLIGLEWLPVIMDMWGNKQVAVAYQLGAVMQYDEPMALSDVGLSYVPQSFAYI